jgi:hypothetical protein
LEFARWSGILLVFINNFYRRATADNLEEKERVAGGGDRQ